MTPEQLPPEQPPPSAVALMRMVDFRIPLPWLLGGFIATAGLVISMYYQIQQMRDALQELQVTVKAGNISSSTLTGEIALLKYRVDALESERRAALR